MAAGPAYPDRPVRLIVPFPPGGVNDIVARVVANGLSSAWGKPMVIDNRGGAAGNIGAEIAARAAPDGYTLFIASSSTASNVALYPKLPFDPRRDFAPISLLVTGAYVLVVNNAVPAATVQDLIRLAKSHAGKLNVSSFGEGSSAHLVAEMFKSHAGVQLVHVPYKGGALAAAAVASGEAQLTFANLSVALPQVRAGRLKPLAVTSLKRQDSLPQVPSMSEAGLAGFDATAWVGLLAPTGTQPTVVGKVNRDVHTVLADPALRNQIEAQGLQARPGTPQELARHLDAEVRRWTKVVKEAGMLTVLNH